jgi:hypothetical protein
MLGYCPSLRTTSGVSVIDKQWRLHFRGICATPPRVCTIFSSLGTPEVDVEIAALTVVFDAVHALH